VSATRVEGNDRAALTHTVSLGRWPGAWCPFLSCCSVAAAVVAVGLGYGVVVNEQQNLILGANCDSRYHPGTNGKK